MSDTVSSLPKFSVVIPTYNRLPLLQRALGSAEAQSFGSYEIIVIDDGSTDATAEWLSSNGGRWRVFSQRNGGPGSARNRGIREARGEYVAFLDSDDLWFPWTLETFAEAISRFNRPTIVAGEFVQFADEIELASIRRTSSEMAFFADYLAASREPHSLGSGVCVFPREALLETAFLEDRLNAEDHDLILRLGTRPGFVKVAAPLTLAYRRHADSETFDYSKVIAGKFRLLERERSGAYPGGAARALERHRILARHARPVALACLRQGFVVPGLKLYLATFVWNVRARHWRFVAAFPGLALLSLLQNLFTSSRRRES